MCIHSDKEMHSSGSICKVNIIIWRKRVEKMGFRHGVDFCTYMSISPYKMHIFSKFKILVTAERLLHM